MTAAAPAPGDRGRGRRDPRESRARATGGWSPRCLASGKLPFCVALRSWPRRSRPGGPSKPGTAAIIRKVW